MKNSEDEILTRENCYSINELKNIFKTTRDALYILLKRKGIPKIKIGKEIFFDQRACDQLYKKWILPKDPSILAKDKEYNTKLALKPLDKKDCYTIRQCEVKFNDKRSNLYSFFDRRKVPKVKIGTVNYYSKIAVDRVFKSLKRGDGQ
ncbi:hypothetical protein [Pedobacter roseus]|uniref:Helix-turn-helix domain-containing protein n=1 Tax=Pedobacter roseus TaxID=336820 RepID=A0A7G9QNF0_9SPHI|nr:hypothetical protein [Pedobacter roseus]QNN44875.1 hypothetical protein H9L23_12705 [Pedobacter roseus]